MARLHIALQAVQRLVPALGMAFGPSAAVGEPAGARDGRDRADAVAAHDQQTQQYDALYLKGGWTRRRLLLKVAGDPFNPATERQLLTAIAVVTAFVVWRWSGPTK